MRAPNSTLTSPSLIQKLKYLADVETLTTTGVDFLKAYSKIYGFVDEYLKEDDIGPDVNLPLTADSQMQESDDDAENKKKKETIVDRLNSTST